MPDGPSSCAGDGSRSLSSGHFLDIYGYEDDGTYLDYWDPRPGWGSTRSLYTWVVDASDHQWTHSLRITTNPPSNTPTFTDDPLVRRVTVAKTVHVTELRQAIDELRARYKLPVFAWTDSTLVQGSTRIKAPTSSNCARRWPTCSSQRAGPFPPTPTPPSPQA